MATPTPTDGAPSAPPRSGWEAAMTLAALVALGGLLLSGVVVCPSRALLGLPCPGCGMTRATLALFRGDVAGSFALHPLWPLILPLVGWMVVRPALVRMRWLAEDRFDPVRRLPARGWAALGLLLLSVWALRLLGHLGGHPDGFHPELGLLGGVFEVARAALSG